MINFQRIIDEYKEAKRKTLNEIEDSLYYMKRECFDETSTSRSCLDENSIIMGMFVANLERDLEKIIPLLRKSREKLQSARQHFRKKNFTTSQRRLREAEKYFLQFKEEEFEKSLKIGLEKALANVKL